MLRKAIFGGTFDPIHNGHLHIAYEAMESLQLDKILFMPSGNPPHKMNASITDASIRTELIKLAIGEEEKFEINEYEIHKKEISFTYKTLEHFKALEPNTTWYFLSGVDCLMDLKLWKNVDRILRAGNLVVFNRPGYTLEQIYKQKKEMEDLYQGKITFLNMPTMDISSSNIRKRVEEKKAVQYLLPQAVYNRIKELNLYRAPSKK